MRTILAISLIAALGQAAQAQDAAEPEKPVEAPTRTQIAPYDPQLLRLSEVLGATHYLRTLCATGEGDKWRDAMTEIIELEQPEPSRRAQLISRFNRGYRAFDETYSSCTQAAKLAADRYVAEGEAISGAIVLRFGR